MIDFTKPVLLLPDGSYVVVYNGLPYNVLASDPLMAEVSAWLSQGGSASPYVPPAAQTPDPAVVAQQTLAQMTLQAINNLVAVPANATAFGASFIQAWKAAWKAAGN